MSTLHAALAAHRFGLAEPSLAPLATDPQGWLLAQIGPAPLAAAMPSVTEALMTQRRFQRRQQAASAAGAGNEMADAQAELRALAEGDLRSRLGQAASSPRPLAERLVAFWANHFAVSGAKASVRGLVGAYEREAIRPHIAGRFEALLAAATTHPAMLRYLDNEPSAGPHSRVVQRLARRAQAEGERAPRITGLNENLARELLELHTLGAAAARQGIYTQADVTAAAALLTGWRVPLGALADGAPPPAGNPTRFDPNWHEPGAKTVLGRRYPEGEGALPLLLADLARHPATAQHVCGKLARHFVADDPPPALVERLTQAWQRSDGDLAEVTRALVQAPEAWLGMPAKLKTPEEFVVSSARMLGLGARAFERQPDGGVNTLGQRLHAPPSPAGWSDRAEDWLGPEAIWKRVEWATRVSERLARGVDARALAPASLGPLLSDATRTQIHRAADGAQALALLLLAPEFQRR